MSTTKFRGWFSDVGFTCRVLVIADMLDEWANTWGAKHDSPFRRAIDEVRDTALMELERYEAIGEGCGFFDSEVGKAPYEETVDDLKPAPG